MGLPYPLLQALHTLYELILLLLHRTDVLFQEKMRMKFINIKRCNLFSENLKWVREAAFHLL